MARGWSRLKRKPGWKLNPEWEKATYGIEFKGQPPITIGPPPTLRPNLRERLSVFLRNLPSTHQRWMAKYLRKMGWVVFYLEPKYRSCKNADFCWMKSYLDSEH